MHACSLSCHSPGHHGISIEDSIHQLQGVHVIIKHFESIPVYGSVPYRVKGEPIGQGYTYVAHVARMSHMYIQQGHIHAGGI